MLYVDERISAFIVTSKRYYMLVLTDTKVLVSSMCVCLSQVTVINKVANSLNHTTLSTISLMFIMLKIACFDYHWYPI